MGPRLGANLKEYRMQDELLDIVNKQNQVIGQMLRSEVYKNKQSNFRAVNAFLINDQGKLWIPRRVKTKKLFPDCLDASVAGHVAAGESYKEGLLRETMEELGIDLTKYPYEFLGLITPHEHGSAAFSNVYLIRSNEVPNFNRDDFYEFYWLSPQQLLDRLESGDKSKTNLPLMVKHFFL